MYLYIFWLVTFSLAGVWAGLIFAAGSIYNKRYTYSFCENYFDTYDDVDYYNKYCKNSGSSGYYYYGVNQKVFGGVVAGIAGLGAIELYAELSPFSSPRQRVRTTNSKAASSSSSHG